MKKAQATIEFVILVGFLFFILLIFSALLNNRLVGIHQMNTQIKMKEVANLVITETTLAELVGDGYSRTFELPVTLEGMEYNVSIEDKQDLVISFLGYDYVFFLNQVVFGQVGLGYNLITNKGNLINISNVG